MATWTYSKITFPWFIGLL